jgi:hypothetical protein
MSYTGTPSDSAKDLIRFLLQDTASPYLFTNLEITTSYALQGSDMAKTLSMLCTALVAKSAGKPQDEAVEGLSVTWGNMGAKYEALKRSFAEMSQAGTLPTFNGVTATTASSTTTMIVSDATYAWQGLPQ